MLLTLQGGLQDSHFARADQFRPGTLARTGTSLAVRPQYKGVRSLWGGSALCPGRQLAMREIKDGHGNAVHRIRSLEDGPSFSD